MRVFKVFFLLVFFVLTACLESEHDIVDAPSELPGDAETRKLGETLYKESCASCHGPIDKSTKKNTSAFAVRSSLDSIPAMRTMQRQFSDKEITAIVVALSPKIDEPPVEEPTPPTNNFNQTLYNQGVALYSSKNCASCHGSDILNSEKRNRSAFQITLAAGPDSPYAAMRSIFLSAEEVEVLEYALNNEPPAPDEPEEVARYVQSIPLGTRYYLQSKMRNDFLENGQQNGGSDNSIASAIEFQVNRKVVAFSGGCSGLDDESLCKQLVPSAQSMRPKASSIRASTLSFACDKILSIPKATDNAMINAGLTSTSEINNANVDQVWERIIPTRPLSTDVRDAILQLNTVGKTHNLTNKEIWSLILLKLCKSPHYEVL